jgi:hypothetical protein
MRWILLLLGCVVLIAGLIVLVGSLLPRSHIASRQAHYHQSMETVFQTIGDFAAAATWRTDIKKVDILPPRDGKETFQEHGKNGPLAMTVEEKAPPHRLVTRIVDQPSFGGTWTYELTPESSGCRLSITERGEVYNPVFRFLGKFFFSYTDTMEQYLIALGNKFGEHVTPEPPLPT